MPDIEVFLDNLVEPHNLQDFEALRTSGALDRYWNKHTKKDSKTLKALADFDAMEESRYPGFEAWFKSLRGQYDRATARRALRTWIRMKLADDSGKQFVHNFQDDAQLQRAAMELATRTGVKTEKFEQYRGLLAKFKLNGNGKQKDE